MVDINDDKYLKSLKKAASSDDGKLIIDYLKSEMEAHNYENIKLDVGFSEIGMNYVVFRAINKYFKTVLSILDKAENN